MEREKYHRRIEKDEELYDESEENQQSRKSRKREEPTEVSFPLESIDTSALPISRNFASGVAQTIPQFYPNVLGMFQQPRPTPSQFPTSYTQPSSQFALGSIPQGIPFQTVTFPFSNFPSQSSISTSSSISSVQIPQAKLQRFMLTEQPNERQRKSYKGENRWLVPHPLTIKPREVRPEEGSLPPIISGTVVVRLVDKDGNDLPNEKQNILESNDGNLRQRLDSELTAQFSLRMMDTSDGESFRLLFIVSYILEGVGHLEERIFTRPFIVQSNLKRSVPSTTPKGRKTGAPVVQAMKPSRGYYKEEVEVWIKGSGFSDSVQVLFGDKEARVQETSDNLLVVLSPTREELTSDTTVLVQVVNKKGGNQPAEIKLPYLYQLIKEQE